MLRFPSETTLCRGAQSLRFAIAIDKSASHQLSQTEIASDNP